MPTVTLHFAYSISKCKNNIIDSKCMLICKLEPPHCNKNESYELISLVLHINNCWNVTFLFQVMHVDFLVLFQQITSIWLWIWTCMQVTKREDTPESEWKNWNWRSEGDLMLNGAFFTPSGVVESSSYAKASSLGARPSSLVGSITTSAGALGCKKGSRC